MGATLRAKPAYKTWKIYLKKKNVCIYIYMYNLNHSRNYYNIVNQLYFNKKILIENNEIKNCIYLI